MIQLRKWEAMDQTWEQLTQIILLEFEESCSLIADRNVWYRGTTAPCPAVSRMLQLPRTRPLGEPFFFTYSLRLLTIVSVGFSETPWNFLKPVTWIVTVEGPSDPIYELLISNWGMWYSIKSEVISKYLHQTTGNEWKKMQRHKHKYIESKEV